MMGFIIIFYTYFNQQKFSKERIIPKEIEKKVKNQNIVNSESGDVFYNIEYSGFDLSGNRYVLKSKEAISNTANKEIIYMSYVNATFYFKDDTVLYVQSDKGVYNNRTLDMNFYKSVKANYENSKLFSDSAEFLFLFEGLGVGKGPSCFTVMYLITSSLNLIAFSILKIC